MSAPARLLPPDRRGTAGVAAGLVAVGLGAALVLMGVSGEEATDRAGEADRADPSPAAEEAPAAGEAPAAEQAPAAEEAAARQELVAAVRAVGATFEERVHPPRWDAASRVLVVPVAGLRPSEEADLEAAARDPWRVEVVEALFAPAELDAAAVAASRALTALGLAGTRRSVRPDLDRGAVVLVVPDVSGDPGIAESNQRAEQVVRRAVAGWWADADARQRRGVRDLADPDALGPVVDGADVDVDSLVLVVPTGDA